jgi:hypothetical protein
LGSGENQGDDNVAGGDEQDPDVEKVSPEAVDEREGRDHADDDPDDHRGQRQARVDGRPALAELPEERAGEPRDGRRARR